MTTGPWFQWNYELDERPETEAAAEATRRLPRNTLLQDLLNTGTDRDGLASVTLLEEFAARERARALIDAFVSKMPRAGGQASLGRSLGDPGDDLAS